VQAGPDRGQRDEVCQALAVAARHAFDLLEPSLGGYGILLGWLEAIFAV
jgi:hypothetical protein